MYSADDMRTPRDRISEEYVRRLLDEENGERCNACEIPQMRKNDHAENPHGLADHQRSLAMVYSPVQIWREIYSPETALSRGTLFRELDKPWGVENKRGGCCRG